MENCKIIGISTNNEEKSLLFSALVKDFGEATALTYYLKGVESGIINEKEPSYDSFLQSFNMMQLKNSVTQKSLENEILKKQGMIKKLSSEKGYVDLQGNPIRRVTDYVSSLVYNNSFQVSAEIQSKNAGTIGTANHSILERFIDLKTGINKQLSEYGITKVGDKYQVEVSGKKVLYKKDHLDQLEKAANKLVDDILQDDPDAKILTEVKLFNEKAKLAGTSDIVVIHGNDYKGKSGQVSIYDFKTLLYTKKLENSGIYYQKRQYYDEQITEYYKALKETGATGLVKARVVPIIFDSEPEKNGIIEVKDVKEPGDLNIKSYLTTKKEKKGDVNIDKVIEKLLLKIKSLSVKPNKTDKDKQMISDLKQQIDDILVDNSFDSIVAYMYEDILQINQALDELNFPDDIHGFLNTVDSRIKSYQDTMSVLQGLENQIKRNPNTNTAYEDIKNKLASVSNSIVQLRKSKIEYDAKTRFGLDNLFAPSRKLSWFDKNLLNFTDIEIPLFRYLNKIISRIETLLSNGILEKEKRMKVIISLFEEEKKKNPSLTWKLFIKNGKLVPKGSTEYYRNKEKYTAYLANYSETSSEYKEALKWFKDNHDFDQANFDLGKKKYLEKKQLQVDATIPDALDRKKAMQDAEDWYDKNYDIKNPAAYLQSTGFSENSILKIKENNFSPEYNLIRKNENLNKIYNHFANISQEASRLTGGRFRSNDLPQVEKPVIQRLFQGNVDIKAMLNQSVSDDDILGIRRDPETGEAINTIGLGFTKTIEDPKNLSDDLPYTYFLLDCAISNKELKAVVEQEVLAIQSMARTLKVIPVSKGQLLQNDGRYEETAISSNEVEVLEKYVKYTIYNIKSSEDKTTTDFIIENATKYTSFVALSFKTITAITNFIGGKLNAFLVGERTGLFTANDVLKAEKNYISLNKEAHGALWLLNLGNHRSIFSKTNLSSKGFLDNLTLSKVMYSFQETGDKLVVDTTLLAMLYSHTLRYDDNVQKYVVAKREKDEKSIVDYVKFDNDGNPVIPNPDKSSKGIRQYDTGLDDIIGLDNLRKRAAKVIARTTGQTIDKADRQAYLGARWAQVILQFRTWIFQMQEERWGRLKYNEGFEDFEVGRYKTLINYIAGEKGDKGRLIKASQNLARTIIQVMPYLKDFQKDTVSQMFSRQYDTYAKQFETVDKEPPLTREQYIQMNIRNMRANIMEIRMLLIALGMLSIFFKASDDEEEDGLLPSVYMENLFQRTILELTFFFDFESVSELTGRNFIPLLGLVQKIYSLVEHTSKEIAGVLSNDKKMMKKAKPMKYVNSLFPPLREFETLYYEIYKNQEKPKS